MVFLKLVFFLNLLLNQTSLLRAKRLIVSNVFLLP